VLVIAGRAGQGAGASFLMPATLSAIQLAYPPERRAGAYGIWGAVAGIGFAVGPLYGGAWTDGVSWRGLFWADLPLLAVATVLALAFLGPLARPDGPRRRIDVPAAAMLAVAVFLIVLALQRASAWGWDSALFVVTLAVGLALLLAFGVLERRRAQPLMHVALLRDRVYAAGNITTFASTVGLIGLLYFFNLYAQSAVTFDFSAVKASVALLPYGITLFVVSLVAGRLADRIGYRIPVGGGLVVTAVGFALLATLGRDVSQADLWLPLIVCGLGVGATFATAGAAGMAVVPPDQAGEAAGTINVSRYVGGALTIAVGTALYLGQALSTVEDDLDAAGVAAVERERLDAALTGAPDQLDSAIAAAGPGSEAVVRAAARAGTIDGFSSVCWMMAIASLAGAVVGLTMLRGRRPAAAERARLATD
jgi:MFS family permease